MKNLSYQELLDKALSDPEFFAWNTLPHRAHFVPLTWDTEDLSTNTTESNTWELSKSEKSPDAAFTNDKLQVVLSQLGWVNTPFRTLLNGNWHFKWFSNPPKDADSMIEEEEGWQNIQVPSCWHFEGFGKPIYTNIKYPFPVNLPQVPIDNNETGLYKTQFYFSFPLARGEQNLGVTGTSSASQETLPYRHILRFEGVESAFLVWLNGTLLGYHANTYSTAEFDITEIINCQKAPAENQKGPTTPINTLAVLVLRWNAGSYLEDQDCWRLGGIFRDVSIISEPIIGIEDFCISAHACLQEGYGTLVGEIKLRSPINQATDETSARKLKLTLLQEQIVLKSEEYVFPAADNDPHFVTKKFAWEQLPVSFWDPAFPNLYKFRMEVEVSNTTVQRVEQDIGFRTVELRNGVLEINGKEARICGVNRHEFHYKQGRTLDALTIWQDLVLMKQSNINALRTSHYPNCAMTYAFANFLGLLVMDEANIEAHALWQWHSIEIADDKRFYRNIINRVQSLYQQHKNFSCIFSWSLGNEAGFGKALQDAGNWLTAQDSSRVVHYEGRSPYTPDGPTHFHLQSNMYASIETIKLLHRRDPSRPVILCEYAHAMGNSSGNLWKYWQLFDTDELTHRGLQGGFIWDWVDQGIGEIPRNQLTQNTLTQIAHEESHKKPAERIYYGGDFNDSPNDGNFCLNGLLFANRTVNPSLYEIKKAYEPFSIALNWHIDSKETYKKSRDSFPRISIGCELTAKCDPALLEFIELEFYIWFRSGYRSATAGLAGNQFTFLGINRWPRFKATTDISLSQEAFAKLQNIKNGLLPQNAPRTFLSKDEIFLEVIGKLKNETLWSKTNHVLFHTQEPLWQYQSHEQALSAPKSFFSSHCFSAENFHSFSKGGQRSNIFETKFGADEKEQSVSVSVNQNKYVFSAQRGLLASWQLNDQHILAAAPNISLWRAPIDNDGGWGAHFQGEPPSELSSEPAASQLYCKTWYSLGLNKTHFKVNTVSMGFGSNGLAFHFLVSGNVVTATGLALPAQLHYIIDKLGALSIGLHLQNTLQNRLLSLPRVGLCLPLAHNAQRVSWFGRGPLHNYPDRKSSQLVGHYSCTIADNHVPYPKPQENGLHVDTRYLSICYENNLSLQVAAPENLFAFNVTYFSAEELSQKKHNFELQESTFPMLYVDHAHMGVGGDDSWSPRIHKEFLLNEAEYSFGINLSAEMQLTRPSKKPNP